MNSSDGLHVRLFLFYSTDVRKHWMKNQRSKKTLKRRKALQKFYKKTFREFTDKP